MRIAIIGTAAVGGPVGARLALAGERVTFIARGANLDAIRRNGIKLDMGDGTERMAKDVFATSDYGAAGPRGLVILAPKAHQVGPSSTMFHDRSGRTRPSQCLVDARVKAPIQADDRDESTMRIARRPHPARPARLRASAGASA